MIRSGGPVLAQDGEKSIAPPFETTLSDSYLQVPGQDQRCIAGRLPYHVLKCRFERRGTSAQRRFGTPLPPAILGAAPSSRHCTAASFRSSRPTSPRGRFHASERFDHLSSA